MQRVTQESAIDLDNPIAHDDASPQVTRVTPPQQKATTKDRDAGSKKGHTKAQI